MGGKGWRAEGLALPSDLSFGAKTRENRFHRWTTMLQWFRAVLDTTHPDRVIHVSAMKALPIGLRPTKAMLVTDPAEFEK